MSDLRWHEWGNDKTLTACGATAEYEVYCKHGEYWVSTFDKYYNETRWSMAYETLELAKAAAQANHDAKLAKWFEESPNA